MAEPLTIEESTPGERAKEAILSGTASEVVSVYANGFILGQTNSDIVLVLERNSRPVSILNLSFTLAKSLAVKLTQAVRELESRTQHEIMTTDMVSSAMEKKKDTNDG